MVQKLENTTKKLQTVINKFLRKVLKTYWPNKISVVHRIMRLNKSRKSNSWEKKMDWTYTGGKTKTS